MDFWREVGRACGSDKVSASGLKSELDSELSSTRLRPYLESEPRGTLSFEDRRESVIELGLSGERIYREFEFSTVQAGNYLYWLWVWPHDHTWVPILSKSLGTGGILQGLVDSASAEPAALFTTSGSHYIRDAVAHGRWAVDDSGLFRFRDGDAWKELDPYSLRIKAAVAHLLLASLYRV